jgi:ribose/xylose/arabinose/galactoside ABC-type transport system permease subunit
MTTINMGCTQMGIPNWIQEIVTGLIILIAVGLDRWRLSRAAK